MPTPVWNELDVFVGLIPRQNTSNENLGKYRPVQRWSVVKSYDEIKEFLKFLINDPKLRYDGSGVSRRGSSLLQQHIPNEVSNKLTSIVAMFPVDDVCSLNGNTQDLMELLQHKENIDRSMQEIMKYFNCITYGPLYQFLDCPVYMNDFLHKCVHKIQRFVRGNFKKANLNLCLCKHYQSELQEFVALLEGGITIYDVNEAVYHYSSSRNTYGFATRKSGTYSSSKIPCVLWLDVSHDDQALGRICIGTKDVFQSNRNNQDSRLANGIFLADIAAIRRGVSSVALKNSKCQWLEPSLVVSIIGAERCLNFQFPRSSSINRNHFIELLRLLNIQGLSEVELNLRRKKWQRIYNEIPYPEKGIKESDALRIVHLFKKGILIEEEIYVPTVGSQAVQRLMLYNEEDHTLSFTEVLDTSNDEQDIVPTTDNVKRVNIDDIAEIRPGKFSYIIDGEELPLITIVSSECVIALPVANIAQRNGVLKKFQDFVLYLRDTTMDITDTPISFTNQQITTIPESSIREKSESTNSVDDIDMSTLSPTKSTTSNITTPVNTRHLSVSMTRSISQTRRNSNLLDTGRDSREYDSFSRARESSMSNRSSISELEFIE